MEGVRRSLHTLWTITKHEFALYWVSPIAYIVGGIWLFFSSLFFSLNLNQLNQSGGNAFFGGGMSPNDALSSTLNTMAFLLIFLAPGLTMRLLSDEVRSGTHELLLTSPVHDWEVVVGKWLGVWGVFTVFILISLIYPALLLWRGTPDRTQILTGYLGYWVWAGAVLAIGVLASALTQYQLVAFIISVVTTVAMFIANAFGNLITQPTLGEVFRQLTLTAHYQESMLNGTLKWVDLAYFIGLIAICLFLATQFLNSRRWRA